ncbi:MAG: hypothetical protein ACHQQQ_15450 [Bacteroidota bacterium]
MFIGHYAIGFASKKLAPQVSLGTLFLSVQLLDLLWPIFLLTGLEHVRIAPGITAFSPFDFYDYPFSHSLVMVICWSVVFAGIYYLLELYPRGAWILGLGVFSHWVLDFITHRPDMPISPGLHYFVGLGLWNSVPGTIILEGLLYIVGVILYARFTAPKDRAGRIALWSLVIFLVLMWIGSMKSAPPPNEKVLAWSALLTWLMVPWGYYIDKHRNAASIENSGVPKVDVPI